MLKTSLISLSLLLFSCAEMGATPAPGATATLLARPRASATVHIDTQANVLPLATMGASPTPLTHVIEEGNTLLSIAIQYGVELADLLLANPGVNPRLLVVGDNLTIPRSGAQGPVPSATPVPIALSPVACYETLPDGLTCLLTASVAGNSAAEGVVALVTLADSNNQPIATEAAYGSTNLVMPGHRLLLSARFGPKAVDFTTASALAMSALNASQEDGRYADLDMTIDVTAIAPGGESARATGRVELLNADSTKPAGIRLVVLALGENDVPVGARTWDAPEGGPSFDFEITVFSLGPPIKSLEIISEAAYLP